MALSRKRSATSGTDYWPGFVDVMATLLIVIIFLLSAFVIGHFTLTQEISGKDSVLTRLQSQISDLTSLLALERAKQTTIENELSAITTAFASLEAERDQAKVDLEQTLSTQGNGDAVVQALESKLDEEKKLGLRALSQVERLNQQLAALRRQISALEAALNASEAEDKESQAKIADLGKRLNVALAKKVQELNRYRSDFFGRLREILAGRTDIRVVGDRFVFPSELLFPSGTSDVTEGGGIDQLDQLAAAIIQLEDTIPDDIDWILRVDGHTDKRPIASSQFPSNWELSAGRAISVVRYLVSKGVSAERLVAAGFGEFQPIDPGESDEALSKNRRIELKLTEK